MRLLKNRIVRMAAAMVGVIAAAAVVLDIWVYPLPEEALSRPHSRFVYSRDGHLLCSFASEDYFWRRPVKLDSISPRLVQSVIACEDRWFYRHPGVNPVALVTAAWDNLKAGRVVRGGSTITMQIARMMEPKERTISGKLIEILRAFQLEWHYSKEELLEIYFNLVPYGGNIEGVGAATHMYFDRAPERMTWSEAAILTAIPASPNEYRPDRHPERCRARRDVILGRLLARGVIDSTEWRHALEEEIPEGRGERPFAAPHFAQMAVARHGDRVVLNTTIDFELQALVERLAGQYHSGMRLRGIYNLAVVVLDNETNEVLALVGSPEFTDDAHDGQINGALAPRSPGSALKPFVYALGFEEGLVTPMSRLDDIPVSYSGYSPENYDEKYHGVVSVSEALINSYNVPAVNLAARAGLDRVHGLLRAGGLKTLRPKYFDHGLPLVLGACEVTLLDLTNLYAMLARGGEYRHPQILAGVEPEGDTALLSDNACYLTASVLSNLQRPDLPSSWEFTADRPTVAWKTGTSYGRRDAWTIGYNPEYTVGVWAGNFSGEGSPYLVGAEAAAPLMFEILDELMRDREPSWYDRPVGVYERSVCAVSGMPPGEHCPDTVTDLAIRSVSPVRTCTVHRRLFVDREHGYTLCRGCMPGHKVDTVVVEHWPARLTGWLLDRSVVSSLPEHNPECTGVLAIDEPEITSPEAGGVYELRVSTPREYQKIVFRASVSPRSSRLHWFLDRELIASVEPGEDVLYLPEPGQHTLLAVDDLGQSSRLTFYVR